MALRLVRRLRARALLGWGLLEEWVDKGGLSDLERRWIFGIGLSWSLFLENEMAWQEEAAWLPIHCFYFL